MLGPSLRMTKKLEYPPFQRRNNAFQKAFKKRVSIPSFSLLRIWICVTTLFGVFMPFLHCDAFPVRFVV